MNATPRDAWNALAGKGIYPPWTERGAEQWDKDEENTKKSKTEIDTSKKATDVARWLGDKMTRTFDEKYRKNVEEALKNLTDQELAVFDATLDRVATIRSGSGVYEYLKRDITVPTQKATDLDRELGYDFRAATFFHEYGHFVSHCMAEKNPQEGWQTKYDFAASHEVGRTVAADVLNFFNTCISEQGGRQLADLSRLPRIVTNSRFNTQDLVYYGHAKSYNKSQANGAEAWAEYFSIKMTKDKKGEEAYKKYMPKTYELFESYYKNLGDMV